MIDYTDANNLHPFPGMFPVPETGGLEPYPGNTVLAPSPWVPFHTRPLAPNTQQPHGAASDALSGMSYRILPVVQ